MIIDSQLDLKSQIYPIIYYPKKKWDYEQITDLKSNSNIQVIDAIDSQVIDLIKLNHPENQFSKSDLDDLLSNFFLDLEKDKYGNWVYFPWKLTLVHLLPEEEFIKVRTVRNNYKITPSEQQELRRKKIGIIGLSVGQSIALAMALERSCGEMRLADFDVLELSNLNRLKAGVTSLGLEKVVIAAREISEIDPYLKLTLFREGVNESNLDDFLLEGGKLDLLIDECDSLDIKILARERARSHLIPTLMETSDRGMIDVERFDLEPNRAIFHGLVEGVDRESIKHLSNKERVSIVLKITGLETLSSRMKASLLEIGQSITSWPQLASGVFLGGASIAHYGRRLLLGENLPSGRFYVDFDELIKLDNSEIPDLNVVHSPISEIAGSIIPKIPDNLLQSGYLLDKEELEQLLTMANMAPSGGNIQPWIWVFDRKGILHLFHDRERSHSLLDFMGTGSLIAFGAALENLRLFSAKMGLEIEILHHIQSFDDDLIASIRFISKLKTAFPTTHSELADGILLRCTNRKNNSRELISQTQLDDLMAFALEEGLHVKHTEDLSDLSQLAQVVGGMDRMRFFHEQGLTDFIKEVRWTEKEALETKDGIDIATLEMSGTEKAAIGLLKDPRTVKFFRKFFMGYGLTKISKDTLTTSSSIMLLQSSKFNAESYLKAGSVLQRIWIRANLLGISFQPVTAMLFIFHKVQKEKDHGFSMIEEKEIRHLKQKFDQIFKNSENLENLFMFRLNKAGEPSARALRRNVSDSLIVI
jgi:molybdopterin/thiamine biosynthesis adenylyltransferase